jgi:hypothetical protein
MSLSATVAQPGYADVFDLGTYPIHDLGSEQGRALIARCRQEPTDTGVCNLPGFIRPEAVARMVEIAGELAGKGVAVRPGAHRLLRAGQPDRRAR